jgi:tyrosyl-DNA phosphodiesterase 2
MSRSGSDSDSDSTMDESLIPSREECQNRISKFVTVTGCDEAEAQMRLQKAKWDLQAAIDKHFGGGEAVSGGQQEGKEDLSGVSSSAAASPIVTTCAPTEFTFLTWNIDGLDEKNLGGRIGHIAEQIEAAKVSVVCLQEVVPQTLKFIREKMTNYQVITQSSADDGGSGRDFYFTVTLLRRFNVYLDSFATEMFPGSLMGRGLQVVECHIGKAKLCILNTHLESTKDYAEERIRELRTCFKTSLDQPEDTTVIFAGDLNVRDKEIGSLGGVPAGMDDLWVRSGSRKECQYTWDMTRNTNKEFPGRFKPRCRFDRVYLRDSAPRRAKPEHFGLFGIEKVRGTQSFPSDHWGLLTAFTVKSD